MADEFDPHDYDGPLSALSDEALGDYLETKEPGSPGFIAGMRERAQRVTDGTAQSGSHHTSPNGSGEADDDGTGGLTDAENLRNQLAKVEHERDKHEAHAAEMKEVIQQLRFALKERGDDPDRIVEGPHGLEWQRPIPIENADAPEPLPLSAFPDWIRDHVQSVAAAVQVPSDLPALLSLTLLSGAVQKKAELHVRDGWKVPLSLWGAGIMESGGRKSPTYKHMNAPVEEYERRLRKQVRKQHKQSKDKREVLEARLKAAKSRASNAEGEEREEAERNVRAAREELEVHQVLPIPQLWIDDVTSESLLQELDRNYGRILAMSAEGDLFKFMAGHYKGRGSVLNVYKKSWTGGEAVRDNRMSREGSDVANPALAVGICPQPQVLEDLARKRTFRGEGLLARFLYAVPPSQVGYRKTGQDVPPLDGAAKARYEKQLTRLLDSDPRAGKNGEYVPHELRLSEDARPVLWDFEKEVELMLRTGGRLDGMNDWGGKLVGQALRIAGLLHVASTGNLTGDVSADVMHSAVGLARAFVPHAKAAYGLLNANERTRLVRYVWRRICETLSITPASQYSHNSQNEGKGSNSANIANCANGGMITKRDLFEATKGKSEIGSVSDLEMPLRQLAVHNLIQVLESTSSGPGRPESPKIFVNPLIRREE
jgi:hypothetical protein